MPDPADVLLLEEYRALRATIRERGTARHIVVLITFVAWAALLVAFAELFARHPLVLAAPLIVLAAGFEVQFALHVGAERVGRFIHVVHESLAGHGGWEHAAQDAAADFPPGLRLRPLFPALFLAAGLADLVVLRPRLAAVGRPWLVFALLVGLHVAYLLRVTLASRAARRQRAIDQAVFERWRDRRAGV